jgi:hypothetical protein
MPNSISDTRSNLDPTQRHIVIITYKNKQNCTVIITEFYFGTELRFSIRDASQFTTQIT